MWAMVIFNFGVNLKSIFVFSVHDILMWIKLTSIQITVVWVCKSVLLWKCLSFWWEKKNSFPSELQLGQSFKTYFPKFVVTAELPLLFLGSLQTWFSACECMCVRVCFLLQNLYINIGHLKYIMYCWNLFLLTDRTIIYVCRMLFGSTNRERSDTLSLWRL